MNDQTKQATEPHQYISDHVALAVVITRLNQMPGNRQRAIDTETTGAVPGVHRLKTIQIGISGLPVYVIHLERLPEESWDLLKTYLARPYPNVLQNAKFDLKMLGAEGFVLNGAITDTLLLSRLLHLGQQDQKHNLGALMQAHLGVVMDKTQQKNFLGDESRELLSPKQVAYCGDDVAQLERLSQKLRQALRQRGIKDSHCERELAFLPLLAQMELRGVGFNTAAHQTHLKELTQALKASEQATFRRFSSVSNQQCRLDFGNKTPQVTTANAYTPCKLGLKELQALGVTINPPNERGVFKALSTPKQAIVTAYLQQQSLTKLYKHCLEVKAHVRPDGRFAADHNQIERSHGLLGHSHTHIEAYLKQVWQLNRAATPCLFNASPGSQLMMVSFPELPLWFLAQASQSKPMLEAIDQGLSLYTQCQTALTLAKVECSPVLAQALWYGCGILQYKGVFLQTWLYQEYGLILANETLKACQTHFSHHYPELEPFYKGLKQTRFAQRTTQSGSQRHWSYQSSNRDIITFCIWGSVHDWLKTAALAIQRSTDPEALQLCFIEPTALFYEAKTEAAKGLLEHILTGLPPIPGNANKTLNTVPFQLTIL